MCIRIRISQLVTSLPYRKKMNNNIPVTLNEMINLLESVRNDYDKFYDNGNASAGTRVRKAMQEVKATAQEVRLHVQETKNNK